jgi:hypothetical protein
MIPNFLSVEIGKIDLSHQILVVRHICRSFSSWSSCFPRSTLLIFTCSKNIQNAIFIIFFFTSVDLYCGPQSFFSWKICKSKTTLFGLKFNNVASPWIIFWIFIQSNFVPCLERFWDDGPLNIFYVGRLQVYYNTTYNI